MQSIQQAQQLLRRYVANHELLHGSTPMYNVQSDMFTIRDIIEQLGYDKTRLLFAYWFKTAGDHDLRQLFRSYDRMYANMQAELADRAHRIKLRQETEAR